MHFVVVAAAVLHVRHDDEIATYFVGFAFSEKEAREVDRVLCREVAV